METTSCSDIYCTYERKAESDPGPSIEEISITSLMIRVPMEVVTVTQLALSVFPIGFSKV